MELLAPCGTTQALLRAVAAGANAVYFGLGELNARAKSVDFNMDNLSIWVDYCHLFDVKVYVTLNVEIYDNEMDRALSLVECAYNAKVDALIISDLGLILAVRKNYPDFPIHVSTQAGVKDVNGALFYKKLGVKRVVLARECSLADYAEISKIIEIEAFVHGALCVSFSGACLMSSYIGGNSGNRGKCKQPCRQEYTAFDERGNILKKGYLLSPKDINTSYYLDKMYKSGVSSLKIEGRLKSPEYVYAVTSYYRGLLDGYSPSDNDVLKTFNRGGFCEGYFNGNDIIYPKVANHIGVKAGKVLRMEKRAGFSFAEVDCEVCKGDGLKILRKGIEVGGSDVTSVTKTANGYLIPVSREVKPDDEVRITKDKSYSEQCSKRFKKIGISLKITFTENEAILKAEYKGYNASVTEKMGDIPRVLEYDEVKVQLSKLGETNFVLDRFEFEGRGFLPKSSLNSMRNRVAELLQKEIIKGYSPIREGDVIPTEREYKSKLDGLIIEISTPNISGNPSAVVYKPYKLDDAINGIAEIKKSVDNVFLRLPILLSNSITLNYVNKALELGFGFYVDNIGLIESCRSHNIPYIVGTTLNISNTLSSRLFYDASAIIYTHEVGESPTNEGYTYQYGRLPLMHFYHCPNKTITRRGCVDCKTKGRTIFLEGDGKRFPVKAVLGDRCYYSLYADKYITVKTDKKKIFRSLCD